MADRELWLAGLRDGEPCDHPGCLSHISHPCEGCGRVAGKKSDPNRPFPIQGWDKGKSVQPSSIPWWLAEIAYEYYAEQFGRLQSLERLAERGGFGRGELLSLLRRKLD